MCDMQFSVQISCATRELNMSKLLKYIYIYTHVTLELLDKFIGSLESCMRGLDKFIEPLVSCTLAHDLMCS